MPPPQTRAPSAKPVAKPAAAIKLKLSEKAKLASAATTAAKKPAASVTALSPQAKAYAKKQEKLKAASSSSSTGPGKVPKKKTVISEDHKEDGDDVSIDKLANNILYDSDLAAPAPTAQPRETSARPARRAAGTAAAKKKPVCVVSDEDSPEEESEAYNDGSD